LNRREQVGSITKIISALTRVAASVWTPTAEYIVRFGAKGADTETVRRFRETKRAVEDAQFASYRALRSLLAPEQVRKLKQPLSLMIQEDYQKQVRLMGAGTIRF
jgi:hypothetical protein